MPDFSLFPDLAPHAPVVKHVAKHVTHAAVQAKPVIQTIHTGFSMLTLFISSFVSSAVSAGLAWYIRGRGMAGVKIDLDNTKKELTAIKDKVTGATVAPVA